MDQKFVFIWTLKQGRVQKIVKVFEFYDASLYMSDIIEAIKKKICFFTFGNRKIRLHRFTK